ncbi:MAG: hypothetical protein H0U27_03810 [Nitrosopumilus sp.]|nr:hypothetical protein [Nitrosopumilus sp.]
MDPTQTILSPIDRPPKRYKSVKYQSEIDSRTSINKINTALIIHRLKYEPASTFFETLTRINATAVSWTSNQKNWLQRILHTTIFPRRINELPTPLLQSCRFGTVEYLEEFFLCTPASHTTMVPQDFENENDFSEKICAFLANRNTSYNKLNTNFLSDCEQYFLTFFSKYKATVMGHETTMPDDEEVTAILNCIQVYMVVSWISSNLNTYPFHLYREIPYKIAFQTFLCAKHFAKEDFFDFQIIFETCLSSSTLLKIQNEFFPNSPALTSTYSRVEQLSEYLAKYHNSSNLEEKIHFAMNCAVLGGFRFFALETLLEDLEEALTTTYISNEELSNKFPVFLNYFILLKIALKSPSEILNAIHDMAEMALSLHKTKANDFCLKLYCYYFSILKLLTGVAISSESAARKNLARLAYQKENCSIAPCFIDACNQWYPQIIAEKIYEWNKQNWCYLSLNVLENVSLMGHLTAKREYKRLTSGTPIFLLCL